MTDPTKDLRPADGLSPGGGIPSTDPNPSPAQHVPPDMLRYRPGIVALAAFVLAVCAVTFAARWVDGRFFPDRPVSQVICRNPSGRLETLPRGSTVGGALERWGEDTAGIPAVVLKRKVPDGSRITLAETRSGRRVSIEELPAAERYALGLDFDINRTGPSDLDLIPGIGESSALKVWRYARGHGGYGSPADLMAVPGLGKDKAMIIARYVSFGPAIGTGVDGRETASPGPAGGTTPRPSDKLGDGDEPVDINSADFAQLMRIPGVGETTARRIVECREKTGPFRTVADLERVDGIGKKKAERIGRYVDF